MTHPRNCLPRLVACVAWAAFAAFAGAANAATPAPDFAPSPGTDAERAAGRLGYDTYEVANLIAAPAVLFGSDAQRFLDATFAEIDARADATLRARFRAIREQLRSSPTTFDPAEASRSYLAADHDLVATLDAPEFGAYELGSFVATIAFNARVLREDATDVDFRRGVGSRTALDASVPGIADARAKLAADAPGAWDAIATDATALATLIVGGPPTEIRPGPKDVWALLVRGRPIASDGPRQGSLHTSIEIVYGNGTHTTIGAYPNGTYDFSATGGKLVCATGLEPPGGPSRAYALVPPKTVTYDALAQRFLAACTAFDKRRPRFRYSPQDDRSNDNAFVSGLLKAESLELPQGL